MSPTELPVNVTMPLIISGGSSHSAAVQDICELCSKLIIETSTRHAYATILTPAFRWWYRWICSRAVIHLCACRGVNSDQLKARITGVSSIVTNRVASKCHHAILYVSWIITQCCRAILTCVLVIVYCQEFLDEAIHIYSVLDYS